MTFPRRPFSLFGTSGSNNFLSAKEITVTADKLQNNSLKVARDAGRNKNGRFPMAQEI